MGAKNTEKSPVDSSGDHNGLQSLAPAHSPPSLRRLAYNAYAQSLTHPARLHRWQAVPGRQAGQNEKG